MTPEQQPLSDLHEPINRDPNMQRTSRRIKGIKIALPLIAITLTAATIIWTFMAGENIELQATKQILGTISKNELVNPRFESTDNKNQPYTITADRAVRGETDNDLIILDRPAGDILLSNGQWIAAKAGEGAFNQSKQHLILRKNVNIYDDQGYALETTEMNIDMKEETILSNTPISAKGPSGAITAQGMYNNSKTGLLSFNGPATLTIYTKSGQNGLKDLKQ